MTEQESKTRESSPPEGGAECACGSPGGHCVCALVAFIEYLKWRTENERDVLILVTGPTGEGKSTVVWWLFHLIDPTFRYWRMPLSQEKFIDILKQLGAGQAVTLDEGQQGAESRRAMSKDNQPLNEFVEVCRMKSLIMAVCKPHIAWIDKKLKHDKALYWIHVPEAGWAILHEAHRPGVGYQGPTMTVDPEADHTEWVPLLHFQFPSPEGFLDWSNYKRAKWLHVDRFTRELKAASQRGKKSRRKAVDSKAET